jgi:CRISPR-associated protein Csy2
MSQCPKFQFLLLAPHVQVQNANAISSPLTHGFPAMSAFLGLMWALNRQTAAQGMDWRFKAVGVVCHDFQEQSHDGFVRTFCLTRNPVGKDGSPAAIVEEGRIHLQLSLLFGFDSESLQMNATDQALREQSARRIGEMLGAMRIAGGNVIAFNAQKTQILDWGDNAAFRRLRYWLVPGFTLVSREDLLDARHAELQKNDPAASRLDAWLSLSRWNWRWQAESESETEGKAKGEWQHDRKGWIVPIPVGYGGLGALHAPGTVANARDGTTPFRFVESLYSIGQWIGPHRLKSLREMLWHADGDAESGLYRCRNDFVSCNQQVPLDFFD